MIKYMIVWQVTLKPLISGTFFPNLNIKIQSTEYITCWCIKLPLAKNSFLERKQGWQKNWIEIAFYRLLETPILVIRVNKKFEK